MHVLRAITADDCLGEPWPPSSTDHWHLVHRTHGFTLWRRVALNQNAVAVHGVDHVRHRGVRPMALGKRKNLEIMPILKYDARVGRFITQDRGNENGEWQTVQNDVTDNLEAIFDLENLEVGVISYPKGAPPETKLVPVGQPIPDPPDDTWKEGLRVLVLLHGEGTARELMGTSTALWVGMDTLHDAFVAQRHAHPGEVPVVALAGVKEVKTKTGSSCEPQFELTGWASRPPSLPEKSAPRPQPASKPRATTPAPKAAGALDMKDGIPF
jgi:hypothetical protein